jgi:hypothetical protein
MSYLRNCWYVAAMHDELPAGQLLRKLRALIEAEAAG